ncbi:MAG: menaquinol-cytochrome c reductase cytochrome b subunit [Acidimicrobiales bacterium]
MTEIPEHLRKRAEEARARKAAEQGGGDAAPATDAAAATATPSEEAAPSAAASRIPAHLLERSKAAKATSAGADDETGGGGGVAVAAPPMAGVAAAAAAGPPLAAGPGGHTQRLLTVIKAGSIQDVKSTPIDKVHVWPHLLVVEFVAVLASSAFVFIFSVFVNAPLLTLANINQTPNPSKAPWYFLGLQELLRYFHPMVAGVTIPGIGLFALILAPFTDRNPSNKPEDRKFAICLMTVHLMFWAALTILGVFFRGPGFNFTFPWREGLFFEI